MCLSGAEALALILSECREANLATLVIWMKGEPEDSLHRATNESIRLREASAQFWDEKDDIGAELARKLKRRGSIAWDIYLGYLPGVTWGRTPPRPKSWVHQMGEPRWVGPEHCQPDELLGRLSAVVTAITSQITQSNGEDQFA